MREHYRAAIANRFTTTAFAFALLATPVLTSGQSDEEDVFTLSPFEVDGSGDVGYAAQNTLAGSRLNTNLKDVAAPIEVFTREFLDDIGATSLEDAMEYHSNAQEDLGDENADMQQDYKMQAQVRTRYKVRGMPQTRSRDYFRFHLPIDFFSTERVDASRGPNSILFGIGSAGGVTNTTSKQANLRRNKTNVGIRVGDDSYLRTTIDHNQVLAEGRFALRINLLQQDGRSWHAYGRDEKEGIQLATKLKVGENTRIRTDFEYGTRGDMATRTYPAITDVHYWEAAGRPTFDPSVVRTNGNLNGQDSTFHTQVHPFTGEEVRLRIINAARNDNAERYTWIDNDGTFYSTANRYTYPNRGRSMLPQDRIYGTMINGPASERDLTYKLWSAFVEHSFNDSFHVELAYNHTDRDWYGGNFGNEARIQGEGTTQFYRNTPDSRKNPNGQAVDTISHDFGGLLFYEDAPRKELRFGTSDTVRATASYELKTERMGTHRFAAMYSKSESDGGTKVWESRVLTNPDGTRIQDPERGVYRIFTRHYITDESDPADFRNADFSNFPSTMTDPFTGNTYETGFAQITDRFSEQTIDSQLLAMQNYFFANRLVTTLGYRIDDANTTSYGRRIIGEDGLPTGEFLRDPNTFEPIVNLNDIDRDIDSKSTTRTMGLVYHVTNRLSLTFNDSENNGPPFGTWGAANHSEPINVQTLRGTQNFEPRVPTGTGQDFGIKLNLFDNKVFITANYFKTQGTGALTWRNTGLDNRFADIIRSLAGDQPFNETPDRGEVGLLQFDGSGNIIEDAEGIPVYEVVPALIPEAMPRPSFTARDDDFESDGYELNMTANVRQNLSIRLGYSYTSRRVFDRWAMAQDMSLKVREWLFSGRDFDASLLDRLPMRRVNSFDDEFGTGNIKQDSQGRYYMFASDVLDFNIDQWIANDIENAQEGFGQRPHKANIWARYSFDEGALKGLSVAGGIRYQSGAEMGYRQTVNEEGVLQRDRSVIETSDARTFNDLTLIYRTKADWLKDGAQMRLQLSVRNVFNDNDYDPARVAQSAFGDEYIWRYYVPTPRETSLSANFSF